MQVDALHGQLVAKGWAQVSASQLAEAMTARPAWFHVSPQGAWSAFDADFDAVLRLEQLRLRAEADAAAFSEPVAYMSGGGSVWHATLECSGLWDGKAKAAAEGMTLRPIVVEARAAAEAERPGCMVCTTGRSAGD